jgi:hypothetical protein
LKIGIPQKGIDGSNPSSTEELYCSKGEWQGASTKVTYKASSHRFMDKLEKLSKKLLDAANKFDFNKVITFKANTNDISNQTFTFTFSRGHKHENVLMVFLKNNRMNPDDSYVDFFRMNNDEDNFRVWRKDFPREFDTLTTLLELKAMELSEIRKEKLANDFLNEMI